MRRLRTILLFLLAVALSESVTSQQKQPLPAKEIVWSAVSPEIKGKFTNMCVYNGKLYASGMDSVSKKLKDLACYDGKKWTYPDSGIQGHVTAMAEYNGKLYAGTDYENDKYRYISLMCWDDKKWTQVASFNEKINVMCVYRGELYIGGAFTKADSIPARHVVRWRADTGWRKVGRGAEGIVLAMKVFHNKIYIGGEFSPVICFDTNKVLQDVISEKGPIIMKGWIKNFMPFYNELYACGDFDYLTKWDGRDWTNFGSFSDMVSCIIVYKGELYIGGDFISVPMNARAYHIARYNYRDDLWSCVGGVMYFAGDCQSYTGTVSSMVVYNDELYIGGQFMIAGGKIAANIAKMKCSEGKK